MSETPERMVDCAKYGKRLPGLAEAPMKGEVGERIYREISQAAWDAWVKHSTMVINEYRLNPSKPEAREKLREVMLKFFYEDTEELPPEYTPEGAAITESSDTSS